VGRKLALRAGMLTLGVTRMSSHQEQRNELFRFKWSLSRCRRRCER